MSYAIDLYDGGIRVVDGEIGRFLDGLRQRRLYDDALIIVASDHGESFRDVHDSGRSLHWYHYRPPHIEQIRVPLIIKFPSQMKLTGESETSVSLLDLAPTVLDVVGIPSPSSFQGSSLLPLVRGDRSVVDHPVVAERVPPVRKGRGDLWVTVIDGDRKIIVHRTIEGNEITTQYYDLERDPAERHNLADESNWRPEEWDDLVTTATAHLDSVLTAWTWTQSRERVEQAVEEQHLEKLRALGYLR